MIDVGNTRTTIARGCAGRISQVSNLEKADVSLRRMREIIQTVADHGPLEGAAISSVVPSMTPRWARALHVLGVGAPLVVSHKLELGVTIRFPRPARIGADRLANASAALARYRPPVIVADFGTALTFDVVSPEGEYIGGAIAPGLPVMTDYLHEKTALLPHISPTGHPPPVGKSTVGAMRIGATVGYRGIVREVVAHLRANPGMKNARLIATGGYARWALQGLNIPFAIDPHLTLRGIARIWTLNS